MKSRSLWLAMLGMAAQAGFAHAADLPVIKVSGSNKVPACATPGRLMSFLAARNQSLDGKFDGIATEYMRHGEKLAVRWDYAFFQMLVETGNLKFTGDVKASQNNFAGLGATGGGVPGERFASVSEGVKAHLQHVLMYTGETITDPIADRTRKVQEWGVLTKWQRSIRGDMTYAHLTRKWSPHDRGYARDIDSVASAFYSRFCSMADPRPELVAEARGQRGITVDTAAAIDATAADGSPSKGKKVAKAAIADARATRGDARDALGAGHIAATQIATTGPAPNSSEGVASENTSRAAPAAYTVLNSAGPGTSDEAAPTSAAGGQQFALAAGAAQSAAAAAPPVPAGKSECRVWQASYGGQKAVIIQASDGPKTNYTVLDVNEGREQREVAAYIAAYAKGGRQVAEFASPNKALVKAFELCPDSPES